MSDNTQRQTDVAIIKVSVYVCLGQNVTAGISNRDGICGVSKCLRLRGYKFAQICQKSKSVTLAVRAWVGL